MEQCTSVTILGLQLVEIFTALQTIILAATAGIAFAYTKETREMRKVSQRQLEILSQDFVVRRDALEGEKTKEEREAEILLAPAGQMFSNGRLEIGYSNAGSLVSSIEVIVDAPLEAKLSTPHMLQPGEKGKIYIDRISGDFLNRDIPLTINYSDRTGKRRSKTLIANTEKTVR